MSKSVTEPAVTEPAVTEPAVTEPAVTEPAVTEPATVSESKKMTFPNAGDVARLNTVVPGNMITALAMWGPMPVVDIVVHKDDLLEVEGADNVRILRLHPEDAVRTAMMMMMIIKKIGQMIEDDSPSESNH